MRGSVMLRGVSGMNGRERMKTKMKKAILAKKVGMTQIFDENGILIPVTVLEAEDRRVLKVRAVVGDTENEE